ncbi:MAG: acyl-CoA dehydratase activase-related protein [Paracoccaceae bacterium]
MRIPILRKRFATPPSAEAPKKERRVRIGIPRVLNQWSTHRFWTTLFTELGVSRRDVVYSSETSGQQQRDYGRGRGAVDCCYPVKCMTGHYGELLNGLKKPIDVLFSPKIVSLPSFLHGHVVDNLSCPRVMAGPESARAGFQREGDAFAENGVRHICPVVNLAEPGLAARQLFLGLADVLPDLEEREVRYAVARAFAALQQFDRQLRDQTLDVLTTCEAENRPCILVLGRPYHMDTGIGHDIESELQTYGFPIVWGQYLPLDPDYLERWFGEDVASGRLASPFDISDCWKSSYSANTNELIWAARYGSRVPWIACAIRFSSYECGMDQPTYTPVQAITEASGTLFFAFQDLDATKPAGSVRIRTETIAYYLGRRANSIIEGKIAALAGAGRPRAA